MRRFILPGLIAALVFTGTACSTSGKATTGTGTAAGASSPTAEQADAPADKPIGKTITVKDDEDSAAITLVSVGTVTEGSTPGITAKNGSFVVFDLKIEGKTGSFSTNSLYVWMKTADGKTVKPTDGNAMLTTAKPDLPLKDIGPGEKAEGKVLLDAKLAPGAKMLWMDALDKQLASWDL